MSNRPTESVSDEELAFLDASVELDRAWEELRHITKTTATPDEIGVQIAKCVELEHKKHSLYRCWKENHPNRFETGSHRFVGGDDIDDTREVCADCGRTVKPHATKLPEIPGNEIPDIP